MHTTMKNIGPTYMWFRLKILHLHVSQTVRHLAHKEVMQMNFGKCDKAETQLLPKKEVAKHLVFLKFV